MTTDPWHYGTWEGARDAKREANLKLSLAEKINTLEDMQQMTLRLHRQRLHNGLSVDPKIAPLLDLAVAGEQAGYAQPQAPDPPSQ